MRAIFTKINTLKKSELLKEGESYIGDYFGNPKVGQSFIFCADNREHATQTSTVVKITEEKHKVYLIETLNSVYRLERL